MTTEFLNGEGLQITRRASYGGGFLFSIDSDTSHMTAETLASLMILISEVLVRTTTLEKEKP